jgi:hypothetical protein
MFDPKSRYTGVQTYQVPDARGRLVTVVAVPAPPLEAPLGIHLRRQGQRLDHLATKYLSNPAGAWRLCELSEAMHMQAIAEDLEIQIPGGKR